MSDNFIPIVSNTPPPIDDFGDDDDFQEYGVVNAHWDTGNPDDLGGFVEPPPIFPDTYSEDKDSLSYITCPSNSDSPKIAHEEKSITNLNSDLSSNHIGYNASEELFSATHFSTPIATDIVPKNVPRINHSPSPNSVDEINFFKDNDDNQQDSYDTVTEPTLQSRNLSPEDHDRNLQLKDNLSVELDSDNPAENSIDQASKPDTDVSENEKSGYWTPKATVSITQEYNGNTVNNDINETEEHEDERLEQTNQNGNLSLSSNEFHNMDDSAKCDDTSSKQNFQSEDLEQTIGSNTSQHDADKLESNNDIGGFADFASFVGPALPDSNVANDELSKSALPDSHSPDTFAKLDNNVASPMDSFANFTQQNTSQFDADFGNFATFDNSPTQGSCTIANTNDNSIDDFDDFAKFDNNMNEPSKADGDDFGDFGTAHFSPQPAVTPNTFKQSYQSPNDISRIPRWFSYSASTTESDENITYIHQHVEKDLLSIYEQTHMDVASKKTVTRPTELWDYLEDIDNAEALKFKWNSSVNHQKLLHALGVNTQNVLFSGESAPYYVPTYYAASLGLLQPNANAKQGSNSTQIISNKSSETVDNTVWKIETVASSGGEVNRGKGASPKPLNNHMDASSINLDVLDQVVKSSSKRNATSRKDQDKLDPELLELAMSVTPDSSASKKPDPLSKILATLKVSGRKNSEEEETLSEEAAEVMQKLPDLSYMRSRVLMFPVSQSAAN